MRALEHYPEAIPHYHHLRDSLAAARDTSGWWKAELWWGYSQMRLGHLDSATPAIVRARGLAGNNSDRRAWNHAVTSNLLSLQGKFDSATVEAETARRLGKDTDDDALSHAIAYALGWVYSSIGRTRDAFVVDSEAVARRRSRGGEPRTLLASELNALGADYYWMGRFSEAASVLEEALGIYNAIGQVRGATRIMVTLAEVYSRSGDVERAHELYSQALVNAEQVGELTNEVAVLHNNVAILYYESGNFDAARLHLQRARAIASATGQPYAQVLALFGLGELEAAAKNLRTAREHYLAGLALADSMGFVLQSGGIQAELAIVSAALGEARQAARWADAARGTADSVGSPIIMLGALEARAAALAAAGQRAASVKAYLTEFDLLESWRGRVGMGAMRLGFGHTYRTSYESAIRLLFQENRIAEAFEVAERARARVLLDLMAARLGKADDDDPVVQGQAKLRDQLAAREAAQPSGRPALDRAITITASTLANLESQARKREPVAGAARYPQPASLAEIRTGLLGGGRGLLAFFWGEEDVYGWWISSDSISAARLGSADSIAGLVDFLRGTIDGPARDSSWIAPARRAYQLLIDPLAPSRTAEVLVVADGPLAHVPLEALLPPGEIKPWGAVRRFSYGPSASVLLALARGPRPEPWKHTMLALGNPSVGSGRVADSLRSAKEVDPGPLPFAALEANALQVLFRDVGADVLIGKGATIQQWLRHDPAGYRYLHFAAHARIDDRHPERTHLLLSQGVLTMSDIRNLRLRADLVTLSACETGLGHRVRGEGIIGLPHAFLAAGARGVVVTLWRVGDRSTADFMTEFYREVRAGRPPSEALLSVRRRWISRGGESAHPSRWAPFILVGGVREP